MYSHFPLTLDQRTSHVLSLTTNSQRTDRVNIHQPAARDRKIGQEPGRVGGADDDLPAVTGLLLDLLGKTDVKLTQIRR
ncbi:MAG: hypothetical protein H6667_03490 [Ardenticatenaceae bacterium]|nr:hypothetical protein [Ardenticatenaceae bacterium]MCB9443072.1 hypothetical protein [Ardenticatenaceae bacterium]